MQNAGFLRSDEKGNFNMSDLTKHHNDGQKDCANGEHNPPNDVVFASLPLFGHIANLCEGKTLEEKFEENEAYSEGWNHVWDQKH